MPVSIMLPLASAAAALWSALAVVLGSIIVGGTAFYFMRARFQERIEAPRASNLSSSAAPVPIQAEVRAIGQQIERAMSEQRLQGETQRQLLSQKLDSVRQSVEAQRNQVDGLRHELRHEIRRRDVEMNDIKHQIASIRSGEALPPAPPAPALPPASFETPDAAPAASEPAPPTPAASASTFEEVSFDVAPPAPEAQASVFEEVSPGEPHAPTSFEEVSFDAVHETEDAPAQSLASETFAEVSFLPPPNGAPAAPAVSFPSPGGAGTDAASIFEPWDSTPAVEAQAGGLEDLTWISRPSPDPAPVFDPVESPFSEVASLGPFETEGSDAAPEGADDLTVISTIDETIQHLLYAQGVTTLDEIACWGRAEARRIADLVGVFEDVIVNQWVYEAQAALHNPPA